jgi:hypothetical protein
MDCPAARGRVVFDSWPRAQLVPVLLSRNGKTLLFCKAVVIENREYAARI